MLTPFGRRHVCTSSLCSMFTPLAPVWNACIFVRYRLIRRKQFFYPTDPVIYIFHLYPLRPHPSKMYIKYVFYVYYQQVILLFILRCQCVGALRHLEMECMNVTNGNHGNVYLKTGRPVLKSQPTSIQFVMAEECMYVRLEQGMKRMYSLLYGTMQPEVITAMRWYSILPRNVNMLWDIGGRAGFS